MTKFVIRNLAGGDSHALYAPPDFADAWAEASQIEGWLFEPEAWALFQLATSIPADGQIVEVGSYHGKSLTVLAHSGRKVLSVDPLAIGTGQADGYTIGDAHVNALSSVVERFENVQWMRCKGIEADLTDGPLIDFLYIDGDHQGDAPLKDFRHFLPRLKPGATVAFHDYCTYPSVTAAVKQLERDGIIIPREVVGGLYVGKLREASEPAYTNKFLFLARPSYGPYEPESDYAAKCAVGYSDQHTVHTAGFRQSMQCKNLNEHWVCCLNGGIYDYFAQIHADVAPAEGWASKCIQVMDERGWDIIHAPCRFKNEVGITSTAVGYSENWWHPVRRITTTELADLPEAFDIHDLRIHYDPKATRMLFNTGCMVVKLGPWAWEFPGFTMIDRLITYEGKRRAVSISEDYVFAHWAHENGLKAGAVKIRTGHWGRKEYASDEIIGDPVDEQYYRELAAMQALGV